MRISAPWLAAAAVLAALSAGSVAFVKYQDTDNRFCISCHLHEDLYRLTTGTTPPATLAAAHFGARHPGHPERCFTCHSGEGIAGWSTVTVYSAYDAARWVLGDRHEPDSMRVKLDNGACAKCHEKDIRRSKSGSDKYHEVSEHHGVGVRCVACHTVHTRGQKAQDFLSSSVVQAQCVRCHPGGPEGAGGGD